MSPELRARIERARRLANDPVRQRQMREAREALARHPGVQALGRSVGEVAAPVLERAGTALNNFWSRFDFKKVGEVLAHAGRALVEMLPANLQVLEPGYWPMLTQVARDEQLCLAWVPDPPLVRELLTAENATAREVLLVERASEVLTSCARAAATMALEEPEDKPDQLADIARLLAASIASAEAGHFEAAQALATCLIDTVLTQHVSRRPGQAHSYVKRTLRRSEQQQLLAFVIADVLTAVDSSFRQHAAWPKNARRASPPAVAPYSRNGTVHAAMTGTFTEATSLKAILLATSMVCMARHPLLDMMLDFLEVEFGDMPNGSTPGQ